MWHCEILHISRSLINTWTQQHHFLDQFLTMSCMVPDSNCSPCNPYVTRFKMSSHSPLIMQTVHNLLTAAACTFGTAFYMSCCLIYASVQVCPANWKPGLKSMVPDAEKSLEYFRSAGEVDSTMEDATKLTIINNKKDYTQLLKSDKPVVIDFMASWCGKCSMIAPYIEELQVSLPYVAPCTDCGCQPVD